MFPEDKSYYGILAISYGRSGSFGFNASISDAKTGRHLADVEVRNLSIGGRWTTRTNTLVFVNDLDDEHLVKMFIEEEELEEVKVILSR